MSAPQIGLYLRLSREDAGERESQSRSGHKLRRRGAMNLKPLEKVTWKFAGEETLERVLFRLVRDRLHGGSWL